MRSTIAATLFYAVFAAVGSAASLNITGNFSQGGALAQFNISGPGFSLSESGETSGVVNCSNPCQFSQELGARFSGVNANTSYEGTGFFYSFNSNPPESPTGSNFGSDIQFTTAPFTATDCAPTSTCPTVPITLSGDMWAQFPDGSYLYDFAVSGSGTATPNITSSPGSSEYSISMIGGNFTGTATPIPEPETAWLLLGGGLLVLVARRVLAERSVK